MVHQVWLRQSDTASVRNCMKLLPSWNTLYLGESIIRTYGRLVKRTDYVDWTWKKIGKSQVH